MAAQQQPPTPPAGGAGDSQAAQQQRRWRIETVKREGDTAETYKVVFMHGGSAYELGLFLTREEGTRVADVLTSECHPIARPPGLSLLRLAHEVLP